MLTTWYKEYTTPLHMEDFKEYNNVQNYKFRNVIFVLFLFFLYLHNLKVKLPFLFLFFVYNTAKISIKATL